MPEADALSVTWVGHSTVLLEAAGARLLTDPLLRPRVTHLRRVAPPAVPLGGPVDAVLISHIHYDHLDLASLRQVEVGKFVVPPGAAGLLKRKGLGPVVELAEGEELAVGGLTVRATHAEHPARRRPWTPLVPALGFLISGPARVYLAGDTDIFEGMRSLQPVDLALLPVWGWGPRVGPGHLDPRRAAEALRLLEPRVAIPVHWGTYRRVGLGEDEEKLREPAETFARLAAELAPAVDIRLLAPGERFQLAVRAVAGGAR